MLALLLRVLKLPALFVIITTAIALYWLHEEGVGREILEEPVSSTVATKSVSLPEVPPELRAKMAKEVPGLAHMYVISADGGGLRAAFYTASVLAAADDLTCGEFGQHVRAASGVSGGALGIATWMVMREEYRNQEIARNQLPWESCWNSLKESVQSEYRVAFKPPAPLGALVQFTLLQDHLTLPLFATLTKCCRYQAQKQFGGSTLPKAGKTRHRIFCDRPINLHPSQKHSPSPCAM